MQYDNARRTLSSLQGVLHPLLNTSAMALELYLKSLSSESVYRPESTFPEVSRIFAAPDARSHDLEKLLDAIPTDIRQQLEAAFEERSFDDLKGTFRKALLMYNGLLMASRYPFEERSDIAGFPLQSLMELVDFLGQFVGRLDPVDRIHWE